MPSEAPPLVAITYKGRTYAPLVIENINVPLGSSIDVNGNFTNMLIPMTFSTLTAIDGNDWMKYSTAGFLMLDIPVLRSKRLILEMKEISMLNAIKLANMSQHLTERQKYFFN